MKLGEIANILGSNIRAARGATELAEREPVGYSIDSRTVREGELFFAIRGEHYDRLRPEHPHGDADAGSGDEIFRATRSADERLPRLSRATSCNRSSAERSIRRRQR